MIGGAEKIENKKALLQGKKIQEAWRVFLNSALYTWRKKAFHEEKQFAPDIFFGPPRSLMVDPLPNSGI